MHSISSRLYTGFIFNESLCSIKLPLFSARISSHHNKKCYVLGKKLTALDWFYLQEFLLLGVLFYF